MFNKQVPNWMESLPPICAALRAAPEQSGVLVGRLLAAGVWSELREWASGLLTYPMAGYRGKQFEELGPHVACVLAGAANLGDTELSSAVVGFLCQDDDDLIGCAMSTLRAAATRGTGDHGGTVLDTVAKHAAGRLERRLAQPVRAADDWSIRLLKGCDCELCATLGEFLGDPARRSLEWPLAEQRRRHVHSRIDQADLPVDHQTRRSGRPYTLVLHKTDALFEREHEVRRRDRDDLAWLTRTGLVR